MRALGIGAHQAPGGVVDGARQRLAFIGGAIEVEVESQRAFFINRLVEQGAHVLLVPGVFIARRIKAGTQLFAGAIDHARKVERVAFAAVGVVHHKLLVMAAGVTIGTAGEVPADHFQGIELVAGDKHPGGGFGQQAAVG